MSDIGRWNGVDALAEMYYSYSTYTYVLNNPIRLIDPDGMSADEHYEGAEAQEAFRKHLADKQGDDDKPKPKVTTTKDASVAIPLGQSLGEVIKDGAGTVLRGAGSVLKFGLRVLGIVGLIFTVEGDTRRKYEEDFVTIYKAPQTALLAQKFLKQGFQPEDFPRELPYSDGNAYFAGPNSKALAEEYASIYGSGIISVSIPKTIYDKTFKRLERGYQGTAQKEVLIPKELFPLLNLNPRSLMPH